MSPFFKAFFTYIMSIGCKRKVFFWFCNVVIVITRLWLIFMLLKWYWSIYMIILYCWPVIEYAVFFSVINRVIPWEYILGMPLNKFVLSLVYPRENLFSSLSVVAFFASLIINFFIVFICLKLYVLSILMFFLYNPQIIVIILFFAVLYYHPSLLTRFSSQIFFELSFHFLPILVNYML